MSFYKSFRRIAGVALITPVVIAQSCADSSEGSNAACITSAGNADAFCGSVLSITTPTVTTATNCNLTTTVTYYSTFGVRTITALPAITVTASSNSSSNNSSSPTPGGGAPPFAVTTTLTETDYFPVYTCGDGSTPTPEVLNSIRNLNFKRQDAPPQPIPACLADPISSDGFDIVTSACNCLDIATPAPVTITAERNGTGATVTSTKSITVNATTTVIPTVTVTPIASFSLPPASGTGTITNAPSGNATVTVTTTLSITYTTDSPTPSTFNIYYTDPSANTPNPPNNFFRATTAPSDRGLVLTAPNSADQFSLLANGTLLDLSDGGSAVARNEDDLYPWTFLQTGAAAANQALCETCGGRLTCEFEGETGNVFALCFDFLALGLPGVFSKDADGDGVGDCEVVELFIT